MTRQIGLIIVSWLLIGCSAGAPGASGTPSSVAPTTVAPTTATAAPTAPPSDSFIPAPSAGVVTLPASTLDPVVAEIARVANVTTDQVVVILGQTQTFADGSLGCPKPGLVYTQSEIDGYRVVAVVGGKTYDYRGSSRTGFRRCR